MKGGPAWWHHRLQWIVYMAKFWPSPIGNTASFRNANLQPKVHYQQEYGKETQILNDMAKEFNATHINH